jgi:hypothetical protein
VSPDTERTPEAEKQERQAKTPGNLGLLHLVACLGTALLAVIAITMID